MNVLAFETCWAKNKASDISWSIFIQLWARFLDTMNCTVHVRTVYLRDTHLLHLHNTVSGQCTVHFVLHFFISFSFVSSFHLHHFCPIYSHFCIFSSRPSAIYLLRPSFTSFCTSRIICNILFCSPLTHTAYRLPNNTGHYNDKAPGTSDNRCT